jgi:AcrR family transcriptional regulator
MARVSAARRADLEAERRAQILDAALRLWTRHGFDATSVEAVAREAGVAKGTIYLYFATKEALFAAAAERWSLLPDLRSLGAALRGQPLAVALPRIAEQLWGRLRSAAPLVALLFRELALRPDEARRFLEAVVLPANGAFAAFLDERVQSGELRRLDTFVAARAFVGMLVMFVWTQHALGGDRLRPLDDRAITETGSELFLRGALATPQAPRAPRRRGPLPRSRRRRS